MTGQFPYEAIDAAIAQQDAITPHLLRSLENPSWVLDRFARTDYMLPLYAFFLLAQFREERAYPLIVDFFSTPGERAADLTGDFVTEDLGRVLASVSGGDLEPMRELLENPALDQYVRTSSLDGLLTLFVEDVISRAEAITFLRPYFHGRMRRANPFMWGHLVSTTSDLYPDELLPEIREAFAEERVDEQYVDMDWVNYVMREGKEATLASLNDNRHYHFVNDVSDEMSWWATFQEPLPDTDTQPDLVPEKIGRNDPCPCGSGRKYKHCCGRR
jgi:hypothetical protein